MDYTAPTEYPYQNSPSTATPVMAAALNKVVESLVDLAAATTGRVPKLETAAVARRYATASTNCWDFTVVTVSLGGTEFTTSNFDLTVADTIKVLTAGKYLVTVELGLGSGGAAGARTGLIRVNGTTRREFGPPGATVRHSAAAVLQLAVNDAVTLGAYCETGNDSATTIASTLADTGLTVARLGN